MTGVITSSTSEEYIGCEYSDSYVDNDKMDWGNMSIDEIRKYLAEGGFGVKFSSVNDSKIITDVKRLYFRNRGRLNLISTEEYVEENECKYNEYCAYVWFKNEQSLDRFIIKMNDLLKDKREIMYKLDHENRSQMEVYESFQNNHNLDILLISRRGGPVE